jgi:hypothetical protein
MTLTPQQQRANASVGELLALGYSETRVSQEVKVTVPTICKIYNIEQYPHWNVSEELAAKLDELVTNTLKQYLERLFQRISMTSVEACHDVDMTVDETVTAKIRSAIKMAFMGLVDAQVRPVELPKGIAAAFTALAPDLYVIKLKPQHSETERLRLIIHELEHLIQRLHAQIPASRDSEYPEAAF